MTARDLSLGLAAAVLVQAATAQPASADVRRDTPNQSAAATDSGRVYKAVGAASWYGRTHHGRRTASGETFNMHRLTAAHRTLPLGSRAKVTNLRNGRSVEVRINDRGPYVGHVLIDLSAKAAETLQMKERGLTLVRIETLPEDGKERSLRASRRAPQYRRSHPIGGIPSSERARAAPLVSVECCRPA